MSSIFNYAKTHATLLLLIIFGSGISYGQIEVQEVTTGPYETYEKFEIEIRLPQNIRNQVNPGFKETNKGFPFHAEIDNQRIKLPYFSFDPQTLSENGFSGSSINTSGLNPYNVEDIHVFVRFSNGSEIFDIDAFYFIDFEYETMQALGETTSDKLHWINKHIDQNGYNWRCRFSPPSGGNWTYTVLCFIDNTENSDGTVSPSNSPASSSLPSSFTSLVGPNKGPIKFGTNKRYLVHEKDNSPFFANAIDMSVTAYQGFYEERYWLRDYDTYPSVNEYLTITPNHNNGWQTLYTWEPTDAHWLYSQQNTPLLEYTSQNFYSNMGKFDNHDGNFLKLTMFPFNYELEWEVLGNYTSRQQSAFELDNYLEELNAKGVYTLLNTLVHSGFHFDYINHEDHPTYEGKRWADEIFKFSGWRSNPYNDPTIGITNRVQFFSNPIAKKYYMRKLRYIVARWGYLPNLFGFDLATELDNFFYGIEYDPSGNVILDGNGDPVHYNYGYTDPGNLAAVNSWVDEMGSYVHNISKNHILNVTATYTGDPEANPQIIPEGDLQNSNGQWVHDSEVLDFIGTHLYRGSSFDATQDQSASEFLKIQPQVQWYNEQRINKKKPIIATEMGWAEANAYSNMNHLRTMWINSCSGSFGTGLEWDHHNILGWREGPTSTNHSSNFLGIASFFDGEKLDELNYLPNIVSSEFGNSFPQSGRHSLYTNDGNPVVNSANLISEDKTRLLGFAYNKFHFIRKLNSDPEDYEVVLNSGNYESYFNIYHLKPNTEYKVEYYNPQNGSLEGDDLFISDSNGKLTINYTIYSQIAYKVSEYKCGWYWTDVIEPNVRALQTDNSILVMDDQVFYITPNNKIHWLYYNGSEWINDDLNNIVSNAQSHLTKGSNNVIFYKTNNNQINRIKLQGGTWVHQTLSTSSKGGNVAGDLVSVSEDEVFYRGTDNRVHRFYASYSGSNLFYKTVLHSKNNVNGGLAINAAGTNIYYRTNSTGIEPEINLLYKSGGSWGWSDLLINQGWIDVSQDLLVHNNVVYFIDDQTNSIKSFSWDYSTNGFVENQITPEGTLGNSLPIRDLTIGIGDDIYFRKLDGIIYTAGSPGDWGVEEIYSNPYYGSNLFASKDVRQVFYINSANYINALYFNDEDCLLNEETNGGGLTRKSMSAEEDDVKEEILLYPNPAKTEFFVKGTDLQSLQIFDNLGRSVRVVDNPTARRIDISDLRPGIYIVVVQSINEIKSVKLVKE